jgi:hypothetical protein
MSKKPNKKIFHLNAIIEGHLISGAVSFSPAPLPGILTEVARFEAERLLEQIVQKKLQSSRL